MKRKPGKLRQWLDELGIDDRVDLTMSSTAWVGGFLIGTLLHLLVPEALSPNPHVLIITGLVGLVAAGALDPRRWL